MSLSICVPYIDVLDYDELLKITKIDYLKIKRHERSLIIQDSLTLKQVFDYTPGNQTIIKACALRHISSRQMSFSCAI